MPATLQRGTKKTMTARLELHDISKRYPSVVANDGIHLTVAPGQIHAVLGENGAGKSTLMKIIYGAVQPDGGRILWNGREVEIANPSAARALGIAMVFQHFSLFDTLTVTENIALGLPAGTNMAELAQRIEDTARQYGLDLEPQRHVHTLSVGECQRVEIVRALLAKPQLLILDEPTSVLTPGAVEKLFTTLRQLAAEGCSILYISHKLDEIRALCHTCTVVRAGKNAGVCDPCARVGGQPVAHDDRRRAACRHARGAHARRGHAERQGPELAEEPPVRHAINRYPFRRARGRDRRHRGRVRQWPAGIAGRPVGRGHARRPPPASC